VVDVLRYFKYESTQTKEVFMDEKEEKEEEKKNPQKSKKKSPRLDPCENAHTMETSRPDKDEDACDEGVK